MNDFLDKYTLHGPDVFMLDDVHLHHKNGYDIVDDAISPYDCLLGLAKKIKNTKFWQYMNIVLLEIIKLSKVNTLILDMDPGMEGFH